MTSPIVTRAVADHIRREESRELQARCKRIASDRAEIETKAAVVAKLRERL